ncbi:hypothetical protein DFH11DRAFT_1747998 [Phellopilus nigrolimitatus]|nr:hypothetical protein DFH11DRAFT_1747998 [Phellopilus nigrolimitatus]
MLSLSRTGPGMRSFPSEMILEIFKSAVADDIYGEADLRPTTLITVAAVCRLWRGIALGNQSLWTSFRARLGYDSEEADQSGFRLTHYTSLYVNYSKTLPLDMDVALNQFDMNCYGGLKVEGLYRFFSVLVRWQKRLRSVRVVIENFIPWMPLDISDALHFNNTPLLENFEVIIPKFGITNDRNNIVIPLANAPLLKVLCVSGHVGLFPPDDVHHNLTTLDLTAYGTLVEPSLSLANLLDIVRLSPALESLCSGIYHSNLPRTHTPFQPICHAKLSTLELYYRVSYDTPYLFVALDHLTLPALRSIIIQFMGTFNLEVSHVPGLLQRSMALGANIEHLELMSVSLDEARQCLPLVPKLLSLAIFGPGLEIVQLTKEETWPLIRDLSLCSSATSWLCPDLEDIALGYLALEINDVATLVVSRWRPQAGSRHLKNMYFEACHPDILKHPEVGACMKEGLLAVAHNEKS